MRFKVWFEESIWNYDVNMFNYDVQVKLWSQLCFQDYDYDVYEKKWYVKGYFSHNDDVYEKYDLSERSILTLW